MLLFLKDQAQWIRFAKPAVYHECLVFSTFIPFLWTNFPTSAGGKSIFAEHLFLRLKVESALWTQHALIKCAPAFKCLHICEWSVSVAHKFKNWFISGKNTGIYCRCPINSKFIIPTCNESIDLWVADVSILSLVTTTSIQFCLTIDELLFQHGSFPVMHLSTVKVSAL